MEERSTNANVKVGAIVQARIGATRLPGKVLEIITGEPMVWHVVNRLRLSKKLHNIILAIPDAKEDDVLEDFAREQNISYFRGSQQDVLSRYYEAAKTFHCEVVARITADCPLIDPEVVDQVIERHLASGADYTSNTIERTFPRGMDTEVFSRQTLERTYREARQPYEREHVTPYIYEHPNMFQLQNVEAQGEARRPEIRLTVDYQEDLELVRRICQSLGEKSLRVVEVIRFLDANPSVAKINADCEQKPTKQL